MWSPEEVRHTIAFALEGIFALVVALVVARSILRSFF